ncbi:hypothetical protein B0H14DRAFT_3028918, partial [Mycena olivaceomarginata]
SSTHTRRWGTTEFPTGKRPGWELDVSEDEPQPATVLESCVVLQSLRQSRDQWMYSAFPRFSGRVRGKPTILSQLRTPSVALEGARLKSDLTALPTPVSMKCNTFRPLQPPTSSFIQSPWQPQYTPYGQQNVQATSAPVAQHHDIPLLSSLSSMSSISPSLINQGQFSRRLAAAGKGSPEQLKTTRSEALSSAANLASVVRSTYYETSYERWILPRGPVICEKVADTRTPGLTYDIVLTMALQLPPKAAQPSVAVVDTESSSSQVTIWKWVGGEEKLNENRKILDGLKKQTDRVYLAHRIPENSLLTQLRNASASTYVMKSIKPGPRKPAQRKPTQPIPALQFSTAPQVSGAGASPSTSFHTPTTAVPAQSSTTGEPDAKRIKVAKPKPTTPLVAIRCVSCQQRMSRSFLVDVRFCRPCVDSGKATTVYVPYRPPQAQYQVQRDIPVAPVYAQPRNTGATVPPPKPPP